MGNIKSREVDDLESAKNKSGKVPRIIQKGGSLSLQVCGGLVWATFSFNSRSENIHDIALKKYPSVGTQPFPHGVEASTLREFSAAIVVGLVICDEQNMPVGFVPVLISWFAFLF